MDISLLHAGLAAGAALAAIPVILHLFMRQTPKHVIFPAPPADPRASQAVEEAAQGQELAAPGRPDAPAGPDGPGPGQADPELGDLAGRPGGPHGPGVRLRHQHVDAVHREGQRPAHRGQGPGGGDPQEDDRGQRGLRRRLGRPGQAGGGLAGLGPQADRRPDAPGGQPPAQRGAGPGQRGGRGQQPRLAARSTS